MKLFLLYLIIKISSSKELDPIPKGNGLLNAPYSHNSTDNLYFIFEHFRHGARSPCNGDFINNTDDIGGKWQSYGSLTKVGIKQQYLLGLKNRKYYNNFISGVYNPKEIKIYCSNYNRTMMSAQSQLLGFYNVMNYSEIRINDDIIGEEKISNKMNLNSIVPPINTFHFIQNARKDDYELIFSEKFRCPLHKEMIKKNIMEIDELKTFDKLNTIKGNFNKKYFDIFSREFDIGDYTVNFTGMYNFCDIYICHYFDDGYNKNRINKLEKKFKIFNSTEILNMCYDFLAEKFFKVEGAEHAKDISILIMSKIMKKIVNYMNSRIEKKDPKYIGYDSPKFIMYSGHDDTLTQMQLFLNRFFNINTEWVPFASTQVYELRKYGNEFYVELYYNDKLKMNLTFEQFAQKINNSVLSDEDINSKCYGLRHSQYFVRICILFLSFISLFIIYLSTKCYNYCSEKCKMDKPPRIVSII
jgi:hypothetical protein